MHDQTATGRSALPGATTPFVGRRRELAEILLRLHDSECRLLTIAGPGGIGKTRLALETTCHLLDCEPLLFRDGVYFVPLQPVGSVDRLVPVIADVLGLLAADAEPLLAQVIHWLNRKQVLLLLDNFEHLVEAASLLTELLAGAPGVKVLVTSREALKLREEWFHSITGLQQPPGGTPDGTYEPAATSEAEELFVQAARRAQPQFKPEVEQAAIRRICRLVNGMPLALELAAAWLRVLSCAQVCAEIEQGFDLLVAQHRNVAERHQSMRLILDQSWQLLSPEGQRGLRRLAVFCGGFHRLAAEAIGVTLPMLAEGVDKAWLYRSSPNRYGLAGNRV